MRDHPAAHQESAADVDGEHLVPGGEVELEDGGGGVAHGGAVDQDIEAAEGLGGARDGGLGVGFGGDVAGNGERALACLERDAGELHDGFNLGHIALVCALDHLLEQDAQLAARGIKAQIQKLVAEESPAKPLTDQAIVNILKKEGIQIARRTVAKYRDQLGILSARMRKRV